MTISERANNLGETEVFVTDGDGGEGTAYNGLIIHPWIRTRYASGGVALKDDQVYLAALYTEDEEGRFPSRGESGEDEYGNVILDSEDFIEAVIRAFPNRLQRKEKQ